MAGHCRLGAMGYGTRTLSGFPFSNILNVTVLAAAEFSETFSLHGLLQEHFAFVNHYRWPSFLRRYLGSLDHVAEGISGMVPRPGSCIGQLNPRS